MEDLKMYVFVLLDSVDDDKPQYISKDDEGSHTTNIRHALKGFGIHEESVGRWLVNRIGKERSYEYIMLEHIHK